MGEYVRTEGVYPAMGKVYEVFDPPFRFCPLCGEFALCVLPPVLLSKQPDDVTVVCHPALGGCNVGFEFVAPASHVDGSAVAS